MDDQPYLSEVLGELMVSLGFKVKTFSGPQQYLNYVQSKEFTMPTGIITDVEMSMMNGYEMMQKVHEIHPSLKFIAATSDPNIEHEYKEKACMFIKKPFHPEILERISQRLRDCLKNGVSNKIGCANCDDRDSFCLTNWMCPHAHAT